MKKSELNINVQHALKEFESLENIQASEEWNDSLMARISSAKPYSNSRSYNTKFIVLILIIVLANVGLVLSTMKHGSKHQLISKNNDLKIISKELLINPTSLNN